MRIILILALLAGGGGGARAAEKYVVTMTAVKGGVSYSHSQTNVVGDTNNFLGEAEASRGKAPRIIFNSLLRRGADGALVLDYMFELSGEHRDRPPYESVASLHLEPGGSLLAASAGGYKYYLKLAGGPRKTAKPASKAGPNYRLTADLSCGKERFTAALAAVPGTQCNVLLNTPVEAGLTRRLINLLPGKPDKDGAFELQYQAEIDPPEGAKASLLGAIRIKPGDKPAEVKSRGCVLRLKAEAL